MTIEDLYKWAKDNNATAYKVKTRSYDDEGNRVDTNDDIQPTIIADTNGNKSVLVD